MIKKIIYLTNAQDFATLVSQGYIEKDGQRLNYSPDEHDYRVIDNGPSIGSDLINQDGTINNKYHMELSGTTLNITLNTNT